MPPPSKAGSSQAGSRRKEPSGRELMSQRDSYIEQDKATRNALKDMRSRRETCQNDIEQCDLQISQGTASLIEAIREAETAARDLSRDNSGWLLAAAPNMCTSWASSLGRLRERKENSHEQSQTLLGSIDNTRKSLKTIEWNLNLIDDALRGRGYITTPGPSRAR